MIPLSRPHCRATFVLALAIATAVLTAGCSDSTAPPAETAEPAQKTAADFAERAAELAQEMLIVDTHVDVPYRLQEAMADISVRTESGDFDAVRAREGGLNAPFMSIYIPADYQQTGGAKDFADSLIDMVEGFAESSPEVFTIATSPDEVLAAKEAGLIALPLGIENGAPIEGDLDNLRHFHQRGVRYITLTHSKNNHICDSSYEEADNRQWNGLSPFGHELVAEMNRLGVMVDISHVSDDAFWQIMEATQAPAIATHSSCRKFTPGFERNMADDMIQRLAENGGLIMINFGSTFITEEANSYGTAMWASIAAELEARGLDPATEEGQAARQEIRAALTAEKPFPFAEVADVADHIDHVVQLVGIEHVGIGSDYDGVGDTLPNGLKDVSTFPNLIAELLARGYSEADIEAILSGNIMRVWREVDRIASELQATEGAAVADAA